MEIREGKGKGEEGVMDIGVWDLRLRFEVEV